MKAERLVEMANDIGNFFKSEPDHEDAVAGVYQHLHKFWEKRMQQQMVQYLNEQGGEELQPIVKEAVQRLKEDVEEAV